VNCRPARLQPGEKIKFTKDMSTAILWLAKPANQQRHSNKCYGSTSLMTQLLSYLHT
jgi:hypothetical protein